MNARLKQGGATLRSHSNDATHRRNLGLLRSLSTRPPIQDILWEVGWGSGLVPRSAQRKTTLSRFVEQPEPARQPLRFPAHKHGLDRVDRREQVALRIGLGETARRHLARSVRAGARHEQHGNGSSVRRARDVEPACHRPG